MRQGAETGTPFAGAAATPFLGRFAMSFHIIPDAGDLASGQDDDFDAVEVLKSRDLFSDQLRREAVAGLLAGPGL